MAWSSRIIICRIQSPRKIFNDDKKYYAPICNLFSHYLRSTGVAFFITMNMSAEQAPDRAVDWDLVLPVIGYTFLTAWGLIGMSVVFS